MRLTWLTVPALMLSAACTEDTRLLPREPLPDVPAVSDGPFTTGTATHSGQARVTRSFAASASDSAVLAGFDTTGQGPEGYADLMRDLETTYARQDMVLEVIAELTTDGTKASRLLRLTADQSPLKNIENGRVVTADGKFYFRGQHFAWVTIDNQPMLSGTHDTGLVDLVLDFGKGTASIDLRTDSFAPSEVEVRLKAADLPFNILTGAYGGDVTLTVGTAEGGRLTPIEGQLRGNVGGSPTYANNAHGLTTSGLYSGRGEAAPEDGGAMVPVTVDGIWFGRDPNVAP